MSYPLLDHQKPTISAPQRYYISKHWQIEQASQIVCPDSTSALEIAYILALSEFPWVMPNFRIR